MEHLQFKTTEHRAAAHMTHGVPPWRCERNDALWQLCQGEPVNHVLNHKRKSTTQKQGCVKVEQLLVNDTLVVCKGSTWQKHY
jgi:hypothetical protein